MDNDIIQSLMKKIEKIKHSQLEANKRYYQKNKDKIIEKKKSIYNLKKNNEKNKENYKTYYEENKEKIRAKNLERYHKKKMVQDFPNIEK